MVKEKLWNTLRKLFKTTFKNTKKSGSFIKKWRLLHRTVAGKPSKPQSIKSLVLFSLDGGCEQTSKLWNLGQRFGGCVSVGFLDISLPSRGDSIHACKQSTVCHWKTVEQQIITRCERWWEQSQQADSEEERVSKKIKCCLLPPGSFLLAHSRLGPRSGYVSRLIGQTLAGNMKYCLTFYFSLRGELHPETQQIHIFSLHVGIYLKCVNLLLELIWMIHQPEITLATAGFNQTDQALAVYLLHANGSQEKIWTQAERSRGIWIAADVTFQTSQSAKVSYEEVGGKHTCVKE